MATVVSEWSQILRTPQSCRAIFSSVDVGAKMERVAHVLQFPVIVEGGWPFSREFQLPEALGFPPQSHRSSERDLKEGLESWSSSTGGPGSSSTKPEFLGVSWR